MERIARRWIEEGWRHGNAAIVDELHAPNFVDHDPAVVRADNEGFKLGIEDLYAAFPDLVAEVRDLVVDTATGSVAVRWSAVGTHRASYLGAEPCGRYGALQRASRSSASATADHRTLGRVGRDRSSGAVGAGPPVMSAASAKALLVDSV